MRIAREIAERATKIKMQMYENDIVCSTFVPGEDKQGHPILVQTIGIREVLLNGSETILMFYREYTTMEDILTAGMIPNPLRDECRTDGLKNLARDFLEDFSQVCARYQEECREMLKKLK